MNSSGDIVRWVVPSRCSAFNVQFVDQILTLIERQNGRSKRTGIAGLIETARSVTQVELIAQAAPRRAWGLRPVDGPFTDFRDAEGFLASARRAAALGFERQWTIHPSQTVIAHGAFSPSREQLAWVAHTTELKARTTEAGQGAVGADGVLVDMVPLKRANAIHRHQALIETKTLARSDSDRRRGALCKFISCSVIGTVRKVTAKGI